MWRREKTIQLVFTDDNMSSSCKSSSSETTDYEPDPSWVPDPLLEMDRQNKEQKRKQIHLGAEPCEQDLEASMRDNSAIYFCSRYFFKQQVNRKLFSQPTPAGSSRGRTFLAFVFCSFGRGFLVPRFRSCVTHVNKAGKMTCQAKDKFSLNFPCSL